VCGCSVNGPRPGGVRQVSLQHSSPA
jgi:hypothetical protein